MSHIDLRTKHECSGSCFAAVHEAEQLEALKAAGMVVNENPDTEAFKEATRNVYTQFEMQNEWTAELVAQIRAKAAQVQ